MAKKFKKTDFIVVLVCLIVVLGFYFFNLGEVKASPGTVEFTDDVILDLTSLAPTIYIGAGSECDNLIIEGAKLSINDVDNNFLLKTSTHKILELSSLTSGADFIFESANVSSNGYLNQWDENSSIDVTHKIGVPTTNDDYIVKVDGAKLGEFNSGANAEVSFSRPGTGAWETYTIEPPPCQYHNINGYAWSENIGWVSTNCEDTGTKHWMLVNDMPGADDGYETYIWNSSGSEQKDIYNIEDPPSELLGEKIWGVKVYLMFQGRTWIYIRLNGNESSGYRTSNLSGNWRLISMNFTFRNPRGMGVEWTWDDIRNLQIGMGIQRVSWPGIDGKATQVYVEVEYGSGGVDYLILRPNGEGDYTNISNPAERPPPPDYGVDVDGDTGEFSGYAWSEHIGWISFEPDDLIGCPIPPCTAVLDLTPFPTAYQVSGWARSLAHDESWDGWIRLRGTWPDGVFLNITPNPHEFEGWAWADMVIGWLSFNCANTGICGTSNYRVRTDLNFPPDPPSNLTETWDYCNFTGTPLVNTGISIILNWEYSDPENDPQAAYEVWIDNNSNFSGSKFNHYANSGSFAYTIDLSQDDDDDWLDELSWNRTYYWKVRVRDDHFNWSDWSDINSFTMPSHAYPNPDFTWDPVNPGPGMPVDFTDDTTFDDFVCQFAPDNPACSYDWTFQDATPATSTNRNPLGVVFNSSGTRVVTLVATDSSGYNTCQATEAIDIELSLPTWKEIPPF